MEQTKPTIGFIGAGITGTALACQLFRQGYPVIAVNSRSASSAERLAFHVQDCTVCSAPQQVVDLAQVVFITTPDDIIADIASRLDWHRGQTVVHTSGVHSIDILELAQRQGAGICCLHPLQTFAGLEQAIENISGSTFAIEGEGQALEIAREMAESLHGNVITLKAGDKVLYHTAAVTVSNYLVTLMKIAADLWKPLGVPQDEAVKALLPLLKGTVHNIETVGIPGCLTGPISRGDIGTIEKHLDALDSEHPEALDIYRSLGVRTLGIALAKGRLNLETAEEIKSLLEGRKTSGIELSNALYEELLENIPTIKSSQNK